MKRKGQPKIFDGIEQFMNEIGMNQVNYGENQEVYIDSNVSKEVNIYHSDLQQQIKKEKSASNSKQKQNSEYVRFFREKYAEFKQKFPARNQSEITKLISLSWKIQRKKEKESLVKTKLEQQEPKKEYSQKHRKTQKNQDDKQKIEVQAVHVKQNNGTVRIGGQDIKVPQRPISPFIRFYKAKTEEYKKTHVHLDFKQIREKISQGWKELSACEKKIFIDKFEEENKEFQKQKNLFIQSYGYYPQFMNKEEKKKALQYQQYYEMAEQKFKTMIQKSEEKKKNYEQQDQSYQQKKNAKIQEKQKTIVEQTQKENQKKELVPNQSQQHEIKYQQPKKVIRKQDLENEPQPQKKIQRIIQRNHQNLNPLISILNQRITIQTN